MWERRRAPRPHLAVLLPRCFHLGHLLCICSALFGGLLRTQLGLGVADRVQLLHQRVQPLLLRLQDNRTLCVHEGVSE